MLSGCGYFGWRADRLDEPMPTETQQDMAERGWVERDGKHYCPRHDPQIAGQMMQIGLGYIEIAPGVWARSPLAQEEGDSFPIEVRVTNPDV